MDKKTVIGLLLMLLLVLGFSYYNANKTKKFNEERAKEYAAQQKAIQDSINSVTVQLKIDSSKISTDSLAATPQNASVADNNNAAPIPVQQGFYIPMTTTESDYCVETDKAYYHFSRLGGTLTYVELKDIYRFTPKDAPKEQLVLFDGSNNKMNIEFLLTNQTPIQSQFCYFFANVDDTLKVTDGQQLSLKLYPSKFNDENLIVPDSNCYIEYLYTFHANSFDFDFDIQFVNMSKYLYMNKLNYTLQWDAQLKNVEQNYKSERDITSIYYMDNTDEVDNLQPTSSDNEKFSSPIKWVSFKQQFFTTVLIADSTDFSSGELSTDVADSYQKSGMLKGLHADLDFEVDNLDNGKFYMQYYIGPNQFKLLKDYDLNMEKQVPLGWGFFLLHWINRYAVIPIFNWLEQYGLSYGIIILILTILLKLLLLPVAYKTYLSSARMRVLKPEIDEISGRFKGDSQDVMMKKQQATMALYKSAGVNPMSGCMPMLLQMPILIAFFRFFPAAYELRQQPFLWASDLSTYDSVLDLSFNIPFYGNHVSLFCLLMTIATLVYTWLNNKMMASTGNNDQMKMMKIFMYIMPLIFLGTFNSFASGLTYYYLLVNLITFLQMFIFRIAINEDKLRAKMKANMAKPVKKSKWQQKMDEMMKQQQQLQKQQKR